MTPNVALRLDDNGEVILFVDNVHMEKWEGTKKATVLTPYSEKEHTVQVRWAEQHGSMCPVFDLRYTFGAVRNVLLDNRFHVKFTLDTVQV